MRDARASAVSQKGREGETNLSLAAAVGRDEPSEQTDCCSGHTTFRFNRETRCTVRPVSKHNPPPPPPQRIGPPGDGDRGCFY